MGCTHDCPQVGGHTSNARAFPGVHRPIAHVEGWIGQNKVSFQIFVKVVVECVSIVRADICFDSSDGQVHFRELSSRVIRFLAVYGNVTEATSMLVDKLFALHEHSAGAATGIVHAALVGGLDHLEEQLDDAAWCVRPSCLPRWRIVGGSTSDGSSTHLPTLAPQVSASSWRGLTCSGICRVGFRTRSVLSVTAIGGKARVRLDDGSERTGSTCVRLNRRQGPERSLGFRSANGIKSL